MSQHNDDVENLELQKEEYFSMSITPFLLDFGRAAGIADMGDGVRRTGVLRTLRKLVATSVGDTDEETAHRLTDLVDIFESLTGDGTKSANAAATNHLAVGVRPRHQQCGPGVQFGQTISEIVPFRAMPLMTRLASFAGS